MNQILRTITLKIHNPSGVKKQIIEEAMLNYTRAYQFLLDNAQKEIDNITKDYINTKGKFKTNSIIKWINKSLGKELNNFYIEPFKDSIKIDFAASLASYIELKNKKRNVSFPVTYIPKEAFENLYDNLMDNLTNSENFSDDIYLKKITSLVNKAGKLRPIFFCRYSASRNYCLLHDEENNKYYAKIYLMNVKNKKRNQTGAEIKSDKVLRYITKDKSVFKPTSNKRSYLIFPLSFGKWQEAYLKEAINNPDMLKTARLVKKNKDYFLSLNLSIKVPDMIKPDRYMGVSRGIDASINYAIVDKNNTLLAIGFEKLPGNKLHEIANNLIAVAKKYNCQIITEKLIDRGDHLTWAAPDDPKVTPEFNCREYNDLVKILDYKLPFYCLPPSISVSSINLFFTCSYCGATAKANRFSGRMLLCTHCGKHIDIDIAGSINLAGKLIKYNNQKIKIKAVTTEKGLRFVNEDLGLDFEPQNPYNCIDEFTEKLHELIENFYINMELESKSSSFKKKYSLIKKLEQDKSLYNLITIV